MVNIFDKSLGPSLGKPKPYLEHTADELMAAAEVAEAEMRRELARLAERRANNPIRHRYYTDLGVIPPPLSVEGFREAIGDLIRKNMTNIRGHPRMPLISLTRSRVAHLAGYPLGHKNFEISSWSF